MQKSGIMLTVSGVLVVAGLVLLAVGNQVILEGVSQGGGAVSTGQDLVVPGEFVPEDGEDKRGPATGVYAVQVMEYDTDMSLSASVLDPSGTEIAFERIGSETIESEFPVGEHGEYRLVVRNDGGGEAQVFGAIGPLPDAGKKSLGFLSLYVLVVGMAGLVASGIYGVRNRRRGNQFR